MPDDKHVIAIFYRLMLLASKNNSELILKGDEKGIQVVMYKNEVQQLALVVHKGKKQKGIKMAEK